MLVSICTSSLCGFNQTLHSLCLQPCYSKNWEMEVHFKVFGSGKDLFGDGFAIW